MQQNNAVGNRCAEHLVHDILHVVESTCNDVSTTNGRAFRLHSYCGIMHLVKEVIRARMGKVQVVPLCTQQRWSALRNTVTATSKRSHLRQVEQQPRSSSDDAEPPRACRQPPVCGDDATSHRQRLCKRQVKSGSVLHGHATAESGTNVYLQTETASSRHSLASRKRPCAENRLARADKHFDSTDTCAKAGGGAPPSNVHP